MAKVYGYARVSTAGQSITRQIDNIKSFSKDAEIYQEAFTGTQLARPEFDKLLKRVKPGDTIVFDEISRMSRQADDGFALYQELFTKGVNLVFLKERTLDTDNFHAAQEIAATGNLIADTFIEATNKVLMLLAEQQVRAAFAGAEHEVQFLRKRTVDGMRANHAGEKISAERTGKTYETPKAKAAKEYIISHSKDFNGTQTDIDLLHNMVINGKTISRNTYYKYKAEIKAAMDK